MGSCDRCNDEVYFCDIIIWESDGHMRFLCNKCDEVFRGSFTPRHFINVNKMTKGDIDDRTTD